MNREIINDKIISRYSEELPLISVIMPAYNSAATIERAVMSCMEQSYADTEVIIIDNGSSDATAEEAKRLAELFFFEKPDGSLTPRIRIKLQDNKGVSAARNIGMAMAGGEWFVSLDSDDYYEPDTIEHMYASVIENEADTAIGGMCKVYEDDTSKNEDFIPEAFAGGLKEFAAEAFTKLYDLNLIGTHSNKLYNTRLIRENGIYYNEELAVNEDIDFVLRYLAACRRISVVPELFLNYVQHKKGQSLINTFQPHGLKGALIVLESCTRFMKTAGAEATEAAALIDNRMFVHICSFAGLMYYRSGYDGLRIRSELDAMCRDEGFVRLLARLKPRGIKDRTACFLLKHRFTDIYDILCRTVYKNKE